MNWFEIYNRSIVSYDIILRDPLQFKKFSLINLKKNMENMEGVYEVSFAKVKNKDLSSLLAYSVISDISMNKKIFFQRIKGISGKKIFRFSSKVKGRSLFFFLDFFLHLIIRGLKRRYIILKSSETENGILNIRFSSLAELEIDDYFFFDLYEWSGFLNIFLKYSLNKDLNSLFAKYFRSVFNLNKLLKYEVFGGKGQAKA